MSTAFAGFIGPVRRPLAASRAVCCRELRAAPVHDGSIRTVRCSAHRGAGRGCAATPGRQPRQQLIIAAGSSPAITPGDEIIDFHALSTELTRHGFTGPTILESTVPTIGSAGVEAQARRAACTWKVFCAAAPATSSRHEPGAALLLHSGHASRRAADRNRKAFRRLPPRGGRPPVGTSDGLPLSRYPRIPDDLHAPLQ